jgi:response regulator RpfG family c-di-GMP phosphodiesterase
MADSALHRILVVDDEEIVRVALRETLRREGYEVVTASTAVEGLEALKQRAFSVILTDHQMPVLTGLEFLARVKQIQPDAARILITAVLSLGTVIDAINKGEIYRFIVKPWLREDLLATVRNGVQRYELICSNAVLQATTLAMNEKLTALNQSLEQQIARGAVQSARDAALAQTMRHELERLAALGGSILEAFEPSLGRQARQAATLCQAMAIAAGLTPEQCQILQLSASLYDLGLVGMSRPLVRRWQRGDPVGEDERECIRQHPVRAQRLVDAAAFPTEVGRVIRAHHERLNGAGYPDGLVAEETPWLARLLAVAVCYAEGGQQGVSAVDLLQSGSGTAFDPKAVDLLLRCRAGESAEGSPSI